MNRDRDPTGAWVEVRASVAVPRAAQAAFLFAGIEKIWRDQGKVALTRVAERWKPQI